MKIGVKWAFVLMALFLLGCSKTNNRFEVVALLGCESVDSVQDLELSIENNKEIFENLNIEITRDSLSFDCGYLFKKNTEENLIRSVLTDIDLMQEVKNFFN
jgi:hypothetical protein